MQPESQYVQSVHFGAEQESTECVLQEASRSSPRAQERY